MAQMHICISRILETSFPRDIILSASGVGGGQLKPPLVFCPQNNGGKDIFKLLVSFYALMHQCYNAKRCFGTE